MQDHTIEAKRTSDGERHETNGASDAEAHDDDTSSVAVPVGSLAVGMTEALEDLRTWMLAYELSPGYVRPELGTLHRIYERLDEIHQALEDKAEEVRYLEKHARHGDALLVKHGVIPAE